MEQQSNSPRPEHIRATPNKLPQSPLRNFFVEKLPLAKRELIGKLTSGLRGLMVAKMFQREPIEPPQPWVHIESLDDIRNIGPEKPLGTLTLEIIRDRFHINPAKLAQEARAKGLFVKFTEETPVHPPALYVADKTALAALLERHAETLQAAGWTTNPDDFIENVSHIQVLHKTKLYDVVADAFAHYTNPGRTDQAYPAIIEAILTGNDEQISSLLPKNGI